MYAVILTPISKDKALTYVLIDDSFASTRPLMQPVQTNVMSLLSLITSRNIKPLNFDIVNGEIKQSVGALSRFGNGAAGRFIILAEIKDKDKTVGYRTLVRNPYGVMNIRNEDLVKKQTETPDIPIIQNGIIRNGTVNHYDNYPYPIIEMPSKTKMSTKAVPDMKKDIALDVKEDTKPLKLNNASSLYTEAQLKELRLCKNNGVDTRLIENPNFSSEQMRVLWVAKLTGSYAEAFADPNIPADHMKCYASFITKPADAYMYSALLSAKIDDLDEINKGALAIELGLDITPVLEGKDTFDGVLDANQAKVPEGFNSEEYLDSIHSRIFAKYL